MKAKLLLLVSAFVALTLNAQTEHFITWQMGVNGSAASLEIQVGDTVTWTWADAVPHTVTSLPGAAESFSSGFLTGIGQSYSKTFTVEGVNDYQCDVHPGTMFGTITVSTLSTDDYSKLNFTIYPNPGIDRFILELPASYPGLTMEVFDVLGKKIVHKNLDEFTSNPVINVTDWNKGVYLIKLSSENTVQTKKFIKQ